MFGKARAGGEDVRRAREWASEYVCERVFVDVWCVGSGIALYCTVLYGTVLYCTAEAKQLACMTTLSV
jgi:hypothetical protein